MLLGGGREATVIFPEDSGHLCVVRGKQYDVNRFQFIFALSLWWLWPCKAPLCYIRCCVENSQRWGPRWALSFRCSESHHTAGRASSQDPCHVLIRCVSALLPLLHLEGLNLPCFSRSGVGNSITIMIFVYLHRFKLFSVSFCAHMHTCKCVPVYKCESQKMTWEEGSPLLACESQGLNSDRWTWQQDPLATEPFPQPM